MNKEEIRANVKKLNERIAKQTRENKMIAFRNSDEYKEQLNLLARFAINCSSRGIG